MSEPTVPALAGLVTLPLVIVFELPFLLPASVVSIMVGFGAFMAFSQRIVRV